MPPLQPLKFPKSGGDGEETTNEPIFMNQKTMANQDVFARLAALTNAQAAAAGREDGAEPGEPVLGPLTGSRVRTHSHGYGSGTAAAGYVTPSVGGSGMSSTMTSSIPPSSPGTPGKRPRKRQRLDIGDR